MDIYKYDLSNFNEESFNNYISTQNWNANCSNDINRKFKDFLWRVGCVDRHAPMKTEQETTK